LLDHTIACSDALKRPSVPQNSCFAVDHIIPKFGFRHNMKKAKRLKMSGILPLMGIIRIGRRPPRKPPGRTGCGQMPQKVNFRLTKAVQLTI